MSQLFEELKARLLCDLQGHFPPHRFGICPDRDGFRMALVAASAEKKADDWQTEDYIPHAMTKEERAAILGHHHVGMGAIETAILVGCKRRSGTVTPRQLLAANVLHRSGMVSVVEADVIFLETKNAHEASGETETLLFRKREELKSSFENLKNAFNEYRAYLPHDEAARLAALFEPETTPATRPLRRQEAQELAILEELRRRGLDPGALPKGARGKAGVKAQLLDAMLKDRSDLFQSVGVFDKAWGRLRGAKKIRNR